MEVEVAADSLLSGYAAVFAMYLGWIRFSVKTGSAPVALERLKVRVPSCFPLFHVACSMASSVR